MLRAILFCSVFFCVRLSAAEIKYTVTPIKIDGVAEATWNSATWQPMAYLMAGTAASPEDFSGRFKLLWDEQYLYLQAEIVDDILFDKTADPRVDYWNDDCLEIFIDSDASGGNHQYNHSAFAYHVALDNQAVDLGEDKQVRLYNQHLFSRWQRDTQTPEKIIWEVAIKLFPNGYKDNHPLAAQRLKLNQTIGFMLAYCDNDGSQQREHFMGSVAITPVNGDTNRGWIDADVFARMNLIK